MKNPFKGIKLKKTKQTDEIYEDEFIKNLNVSKDTKSKIFISVCILFVIFLLCVFGTMYYFSDNSTDGSNDENKTLQQEFLAKKAKQKVRSNDEEAPMSLTGYENPFVTKDSPIYVQNTPQKTVNNNIPSSNSNLPTILNYGYSTGHLPAIPAIGQGDFPKVSISQQPPQNIATIQGISSNEQGENIAIVDGQVLKEGDRLNGSVISNINSTGITFSNGNQISYNIAK